MTTLYKLAVSTETPDQVFSTTLSGNPYRIRLTWNVRFGYWSLSLFEADETPIFQGIKLVENYPLMMRYQDTRLPTGQLMAIRESGTNTRPGFDELGVNVNLYYYEPDAIASAPAINVIAAETTATIGTLWDSGLTEWDAGATTWDM